MSLIDQILAILAPYDCLGCGKEGTLLCSDCCNRLPQPPEQCYRCRRPSEGCFTCLGCSRSSCLRRVRAATIYKGTAKLLIWQLKSAGAQAATNTMASLTAPLLADQTRAVIVPVPTATNRLRRRGYDQAELFARALSRQTKLPTVRCLVRQSHADQIGASETQRRQQLEDAFRVRKLHLARDTRIILVDDVVTTGATLEAAALALRKAGASEIDAVTFAQPLLRKQKTARTAVYG
jgi:ComF family protein